MPEPTLASDRYDAFLALALGALSVAQGAETMLMRQGANPSPASSADDQVLLATLGVIATARTLRGWLEAAADTTCASPDRTGAWPRIGPGDLLR
jgi:hypothetical protein